MSGGGGGGGVQTIENIPDWLKPDIQYAAGAATDAHQAGQLGQVAGFNQLQTQGLDALEQAAGKADQAYNVGVGGQNVLSQVAETGQHAGITGPSQATEGIKRAAIADAQSAWAPTQASLSGSGQVGGARAGILAADRDAQLANQLAGIDYQDYQGRQDRALGAAQQSIGNVGALQQAAGGGASYLGEAGSAQQQQAQAEADAQYTGLAQLSSLLSGANPGVSHIQQGGK